METQYFVDQSSIVRKIWGKSDTILFIFAGAAAEFALNKAVDWLYFTGKLPKDPLDRLFSTVNFANIIIFSERPKALQAIDTITSIHQNVETDRGGKIPDWAYRDVLFMLVDYSIRSYELLERELTDDEKAEVLNVFIRMGERMDIENLPNNYAEFHIARDQHIINNTAYGDFTKDLFKQYEIHLGKIRYRILIESQKLVIPDLIRQRLGFTSSTIFPILISTYKISRQFGLDKLIKSIILPAKFKPQISALDRSNVAFAP